MVKFNLCNLKSLWNCDEYKHNCTNCLQQISLFGRKGGSYSPVFIATIGLKRLVHSLHEKYFSNQVYGLPKFTDELLLLLLLAYVAYSDECSSHLMVLASRDQRQPSSFGGLVVSHVRNWFSVGRTPHAQSCESVTATTKDELTGPFLTMQLQMDRGTSYLRQITQKYHP